MLRERNSAGPLINSDILAPTPSGRTRREGFGKRRGYCDGANLVFSAQPTLSFSSAISHHSPLWGPVG